MQDWRPSQQLSMTSAPLGACLHHAACRAPCLKGCPAGLAAHPAACQTLPRGCLWLVQGWQLTLQPVKAWCCTFRPHPAPQAASACCCSGHEVAVMQGPLCEGIHSSNLVHSPCKAAFSCCRTGQSQRGGWRAPLFGGSAPLSMCMATLWTWMC